MASMTSETLARMQQAGPCSALQVGIGWRHPHYAELLQRRPELDFLEVHSENFFAQGGAALAVLVQGRAHYPISLHGVGLSLGSAAGLDAWHLDQLAQLVQRIEPVRVSDHASFARGAWFNAGASMSVHAADLLPIPFTSEALGVMCANVQQVQDRLQRPILVENLSAYLRWRTLPQDEGLTETAFLSTLAQRTGCSLLVDVNNLYVNALNDRIHGAPGDPMQHCCDWLDAMNPQHVGEIHLAGHSHVPSASADRPQDDIVIDDHGSPVCDAVWQIYDHAVARWGPVPTLVEWDTHLAPLDDLVAQAAQARAQMQRHAVAHQPMALA